MRKDLNTSTDKTEGKNAARAAVGGDRLKPCPLCGNPEPDMVITANNANIWCRRCHLILKRNYVGVYSTREEAIKNMRPVMVKAWNRRAANGTE